MTESQIKVELQEFLGSDKSIAQAAWTSSYDQTQKDLRTEDDVRRVVNLLADEKHSVPFESVVFRFWLRLPIAIDRQHMTHRIASHSGMSGRYRTMPKEFLDMPEDVSNILDKIGHRKGMYTQVYKTICVEANEEYSLACGEFKEAKLSGKISNDEYKRVREFYRGILPQHNMTERVTVINLRSFANYYKLRSKSNAQPEIQFIAKEMLKQIEEKNVCPIAIEALKKNNWVI